jgi:glycosyltransferase involved in cell wall biosynthesis
MLRFLFLAWLFAFVSLAKLLRLPIVWTIHDLYPHGQTPEEHYRAEHLARTYLTRNISVLILNCESAEPLVRAEFGVPSNAVVAPLGHYRKFYPDTVSADEARQAMGVMEDEIVFLYVGTMRRHRNPLRLIQAFKDMPQKNLRLFVVGETWEDLRREMEKAAWGDWRIRCFFQLTTNDQMEFLLKAADFVVMPGEYYLSSAVVMLALSFARPVIAARYGCTVDMVGSAGILYDHQDELALADALCKAIQVDHDKYKRLAEARARSFSWSLTAARTLQAYRIALGVRSA